MNPPATTSPAVRSHATIPTAEARAAAPLLAPLSDAGRLGAALCGNKAARLGELIARGHTVPPGVVVTTAGFDLFLSRRGLAPLVSRVAAESLTATPQRLVAISREIDDAFAAAPLPREVEEGLGPWVSCAPGAAFAVRSSGTNEDLPGLTFAGLYTSTLNVAAADVALRVKQTFASLFSARATLYRRRAGVAAAGAMAAIVQEMVACDYAGVVLTRAPRREAELLIECAPGLGEAVVSGAVSPNRYYVARETLAVLESREPHGFERGRVEAIARRALAVEAEFGPPQEVEYGLVGDVIHILQSRPSAA